MNKLIWILSVVGVAGCDDSQMDLGPGHTSVAGAAGTIVAAGGSGAETSLGGNGIGGGSPITQVGGTAGTSPIAQVGGTAGTSPIAQVGGTAGASPIHSIEHQGVKTLSVRIQGGMPVFSPTQCGTAPQTYTVDFEQKRLSYEHCTSGLTTPITTETLTRSLSDAELTAISTQLDSVSTDYREACGADKSVETLGLDFGDRQVTYQDDFYAGCSGIPAPYPFVSGLDRLISTLYALRDIPENYRVPRNFLSFTLSVPPSNATLEDMAVTCGTAYTEQYQLDFRTDTLTSSVCERNPKTNTIGLRTEPKVYDVHFFDHLGELIDALRVGSTGNCDPASARIELVTFDLGGDSSSSISSERALCPWYNGWNALPVIGLDNVYAYIQEMISPMM